KGDALALGGGSALSKLASTATSRFVRYSALLVFGSRGDGGADMELDRQALRQLWGRLVAEAWNDPKLRHRLLTEPAAVLKEHNAGIPDGVRVRSLEDDGQTLYLPLPLRPPQGELGENELDAVAGGATAVALNPERGVA